MKVNKSQLFKMAHAVVKRTGKTFSEALRTAWKAAKIYAKMLVGTAEFSFRKLDGSIRNASGTLFKVDYLRKTEGEWVRPADVLCYYDTEKKAFRSFVISNLL